MASLKQSKHDAHTLKLIEIQSKYQQLDSPNQYTINCTVSLLIHKLISLTSSGNELKKYNITKMHKRNYD